MRLNLNKPGPIVAIVRLNLNMEITIMRLKNENAIETQSQL